METITIYNGDVKAPRSDNRHYKLYKKSWNHLKQLIESKINNISSSIFDKVVRFIDSSYHLYESGNDQVVRSTQSNKKIPTALLLAGVNTPDHQLIFDRIQASVRKIGGYVAVVNSSQDTTTARSLMCAVVRQFVQTESDPTRNYDSTDSDDEVVDFAVDDGADSDGCGDFLKRFSLSVRSTYWALSEWYHHREPPQPKSNACNNKKVNVPRSSRHSLRQPDPVNGLTRTHLTRASLFTQNNRTGSNDGIRPHSVRRCDPNHTNLGHTEDVSDTIAADVSPYSSRVAAGHSGPLVIIIPRIESIPSHVLQDFIELSSIYASGQFTDHSRTLPICLVLGLSTSPDVGFEARLNASTLGRLCVEWFTVPPPAVFLDAVFSALLEFPGFHPSHSMCTYLVDSLFLCLDYSVQNFIRRLQFCMLDHYLSLPHPELLLPFDEVLDYLTRMPSTDLANMVSFSVPSVAYLAAHDSPSPPRLPTTLGRPNGRTLPQCLAAQLEAHWHLQYLIGPVLSWLFRVASPGAIAPLGKSVSDLYRRWLKDGLVVSEEFSLFKDLMGGFSKNSLIESITEAVSALDRWLNEQSLLSMDTGDHLWPDSVRVACQNRLTELLQSTRNWLGILSSADMDLLSPSNHPLSDSTEMPPTLTNTSGAPTGQSFGQFDRKKKISLRGLRQHLQEVAASSPARHGSPSRLHLTQSGWERKRGEFISWLISQLTELIPSPTSLPMHELFYGPITMAGQSGCAPKYMEHQSPRRQQQYSESVAIRRRMNPPLQKCLHQALADPGTYLQISELRIDTADSLNAKLPDISILYKLHLESAKLINLHDWLMAFASVLDGNTQSDNPPSKMIQARFFHGIAQLHHMGYIKSTRRKADHVMRLSWCLAT